MLLGFFSGRLNVFLWILTFLLLLHQPFLRGFQLYGEKLTLGTPYLLYSKKTLTQTSSSQAPLGLASEISFFFQPEMSLDIQGTTNMNQSSILFIGGSVGLSRYFLGSIPYGYEDATFKVSSYPTLSFYGSLAMTMRTFDLSGVETSTGIIVRDAKDIPQGTFMGPQLSLGGNVDFLEKFNFGLKAQMFQSISTSSAPDFTGQEFWIYLGYVF